MTRAARALVVAALVSCPALPLAAQPAPALSPAAAPALSRADMTRFLQEAKVIGKKGVPKGVTKPLRLTLTDGTLTHDASFQAVNETKGIMRFASGALEINFRDSWHFNVAAQSVAELIGIEDMVPATVEREYDGRRGSLVWWVDARWDDESRRKENAVPPDQVGYARQRLLMRLFTELVYDTDRNMGNLLTTADWKLYMIDFTRAFRLYETPKLIGDVTRTRRDVFEKLQGLTLEQLASATGEHMTDWERKSLLKRRDVIVAHFKKLAAERGDEATFW